jgi:protein MpaA
VSFHGPLTYHEETRSEKFYIWSIGIESANYRLSSWPRRPQCVDFRGRARRRKRGNRRCFGLLGRLAKGSVPCLRLTIVPLFNVDGILSGQRQNANGVDLNRNLPTQDWTASVENPRYFPGKSANSELENQALTGWIERNQPVFILSLHSWKPMLNVNGDCRNVAEVISRLTGYEIQDSIGYPTPGCLGTYCGLERNMPTLTYEIERGLSHKSVVQIHVPAILEGLKVLEV